MSDVALNLENDGATLGFTAELEDEPGVRFRPDDKVQLSRGFKRFVVAELKPSIVEGMGARESGGEVDGEKDAAE